MKRVLLVRLSAMGDVCQSLGAVQAAQLARPDLELHFVTQRRFVPLLAGLGLQSVIAFDRHGGLGALRAVRRQMRLVAADLAIDLQGNWKSALVTRLAGARRSYGATFGYRQSPASGWLLRRVAIDGSRHPACIAQALLTAVLAPGQVRWNDLERPRLAATGEEIEAVSRAVRAAGVVPERPFTVFVVAAPQDNRAWPAVAMERQASAERQPVLWLVGPAEAAITLPADVKAMFQGADSLRQLVALGHLIASVGGRVYGPDVGATHVLAATGAETHALFGPQDPTHTAPPAARIVVRKDAPSCMPCRERRCRHPRGPVCMDFCLAEASACDFECDPEV